MSCCKRLGSPGMMSPTGFYEHFNITISHFQMTFERLLQEMEEAKKAAAEEAARVAAEKKKEKEKKEAAAAAAKQANAAAAAAAQQQAAAAAQQPPDYAAGLNAAPATPAAAVSVTPAYAPPTPTPLQVTLLSVMSKQFSLPLN